MRNSYFNNRRFIAVLIVPPLLGAIVGIIIRVIKVGNVNLPDYGAVASTTAILAALIFPMSLFVDNKKKDVAYIDERIRKSILKNNENDRSEDHKEKDTFEIIKEFKKSILSENKSIKMGIYLFITISTYPSIFGFILLSLWFRWESLFGKDLAVILHILLFSIFCSAVAALYFADWGYAFYDRVFIYNNFLKSKIKLDKFRKNIFIMKV